MNPSTYIPIIILWIIIFFVIFRNRRAVVARQIIKKRKMESNTEMKELAKRFIDKECLISSCDSAILVEKNGTAEAINLDFVIRIREFPRNKKGKKKSVVLD